MDVVHDDLLVHNPTTSLRVSLEMSIDNIKKSNEEALKLFCLIGMLPLGINKDEINQIWGDYKWFKLKDMLVRSSLLIHKNTAGESDVYYMLPFMSERAVEIIDSDIELKQIFHLK